MFVIYTFYHYMFFFFVYSFVGWAAEEVYTTIKYGRLVNRGFVNGPLCPKYGIAMVIIIADITDLVEYPGYQFLMCVVLMAVFEYAAGVVFHKITGRRAWNYCKVRFNLGGYTCFYSALILGSSAAVCVWMLNPLLFIVYNMIPHVIMMTALIVLSVLLMIDWFVTVAAVAKWKMDGNIYENVAKKLKNTKRRLGCRFFDVIKSRMYKAFPEFENQEKRQGDGFGRPENRVFARGLSLDKMIWVFMISAFVGDLIETAYLWVMVDEIMSRSSVLYGPFSIVWGLGGVLISAVLYPLRRKGIVPVFIGGFILGGVYEYSCSVFTELVFGTIYWDYSHLPYNINGRINLLFCVFWGLLAIVWVKLLYPNVSRMIEKVPPVAGKIITLITVIAMVLNMMVSSLAVMRYVARGEGTPARNATEEFLDAMYSDEFIERVYPDMKVVE